MAGRTPGLFVRVHRNGFGKQMNWIRPVMPAEAGTARPVKIGRARTAAPASPTGLPREPGRGKTSPAMASAGPSRAGQRIRLGGRSVPRWVNSHERVTN